MKLVGPRRNHGKLELKLGSRVGELANLAYNPRLPVLDDYYQPFTYRYEDLFDAPPGNHWQRAKFGMQRKSKFPSSAAFGRHPRNVLIGIHDVACLTVNAIGRVEMNLPAEGHAWRINHFVYCRETIELAWIAELPTHRVLQISRSCSTRCEGWYSSCLVRE